MLFHALTGAEFLGGMLLHEVVRLSVKTSSDGLSKC